MRPVRSGKANARGDSCVALPFLSRGGRNEQMRTGFLRCHGELGRNAQADVATDWDGRSCPLASRSGRAFVSRRFARRVKWRRSGLRVGFSVMHPGLIGQGRIDEQGE
jgi:hypothetical protein